MLCGGFSAQVRAKKMRQDGSAEFISVLFYKERQILMKKLLLFPLLFALLLSLSGGRTAYAFATDPLLDGIDVMSFAGEMNGANSFVAISASKG